MQGSWRHPRQTLSPADMARVRPSGVASAHPALRRFTRAGSPRTNLRCRPDGRSRARPPGSCPRAGTFTRHREPRATASTGGARSRARYRLSNQDEVAQLPCSLRASTRDALLTERGVASCRRGQRNHVPGCGGSDRPPMRGPPWWPTRPGEGAAATRPGSPVHPAR